MINSRILDQRINNFIESKHQEMPDLRDKNVDQLLSDLVNDEL